MPRPTPEAIDWLKNREGFKDKVYLDSLEKPTAGYGHLLSDEESQNYKVGDAYPQERADIQLSIDSQWAWDAAQKQAEEAGNPELVEPLFHVNYQLGPNWRKEHKNTWKKLKAGQLEDAAVESADSTWFDQTPKRVRDFQMALTGKEREEEYDG
jgi:GH24 family phage-related lysozyme (muramidase)